MKELNSLQKNYHFIYGELASVVDKISANTIFFIDPDTGETIPIAEKFEGEAEALVERIKKKSYKSKFATIYQEPHSDLLKALSPHSFKVLSYLVAKMGFDNNVRGVSFRNMEMDLEMSPRTIKKAIEEMEAWGVVYTSRERNMFCYTINPAYAWRGSYFMVKNKGVLFKEKMYEKKKIEPSSEF